MLTAHSVRISGNLDPTFSQYTASDKNRRAAAHSHGFDKKRSSSYIVDATVENRNDRTNRHKHRHLAIALMALWLAFAAAAAAVAHGAHAAVQNEAPSAGIVVADRRRLVDTQYSYTYTYADGRSKEIRTCIGCGGSSGSGLGYTKQYKDQNFCPDGFNIYPLAVQMPPDVPKGPPTKLSSRGCLVGTRLPLFDGACRLALEATSPAERAVPCSRHIKRSKV